MRGSRSVGWRLAVAVPGLFLMLLGAGVAWGGAPEVPGPGAGSPDPAPRASATPVVAPASDPLRAKKARMSSPGEEGRPRREALDPRCLTGRALCVDKTTRKVRWVVDGGTVTTDDARFGSPELPTREGAFEVYAKSRDHVSGLYDTSMPFAMFFSGGQAVHYSPDFAAVGYAGASHGCVNVRDYDGMAWLFDQVQVGDAVIVYWS